jgi:hypothetical protein
MEKKKYSEQNSAPRVPESRVNKVDELLRQQEEYKKKAEYEAAVKQKNIEADNARKKATELSKKKTAVTKTKKFDPMELEGEDLSAYVDSLISGNIK